jgi:hypothetical protein
MKHLAAVMFQRRFLRRELITGLALLSLSFLSAPVWAEPPAKATDTEDFFTIVVMPDTQYYTEV